VIALVEARFAGHPGRLDDFAWPVTRAQALQALHAFIASGCRTVRPLAGRDVARRALALPRAPGRSAEPEAAEPARGGGAAEAAYRAGARRWPAWKASSARSSAGASTCAASTGRDARLPERNALQADEALPAWYWTGDTDMACLRDALTQTLRTATPTTSSA
jgi:deoxyribodipyrimidine photolyase-related protein